MYLKNGDQAIYSLFLSAQTKLQCSPAVALRKSEKLKGSRAESKWEWKWRLIMPVLITCFAEATTVPVSHDAVRCGTQPNPPAASVSPPGIKAKTKIMGVSTSLAMIQMITQQKHFALLSTRWFEDLSPNQRHTHLYFTVNCLAINNCL